MDLTNQAISIRGILVPVEWDQKGNVTRVGLMTENEEEYLLDEGGNSMGLFSLLRHQVQVRGRARQEGSRRIILVEAYAQIR